MKKKMVQKKIGTIYLGEIHPLNVVVTEILIHVT